jgi:hypothetical protein
MCKKTRGFPTEVGDIRKCKNDNPGFFTNGIPTMKNPDALRIFSPEVFGGKYKFSVRFLGKDRRTD